MTQNVRRIKNKETSRFDEYVEMPDVDIDDITAKKTLGIPSCENTKKYKNNVSKRIVTTKCISS